MDAILHERARRMAEEMADGVQTADDLRDIMRMMSKTLMEKALDAEMDVHLELVQKLLPGIRPRLDGIVPIGTRFVSMDIELFHFLVGHFDFLLIDASVMSRCHAQAAFIGGASNGMKHQIQAA